MKAHISIVNSEGVPIKARYDAVWDGSEDEYEEFHTADTHALVIALIANEDGIGTLQYGRRPYDKAYGGYYFAPSCERLEGKSFRLRVELIGKSSNETVLNKPFDFELSVDPPAIKLI